MDDGIDLTEEQMAANAEAARAAAPKKRAKAKTVPAGAAHISSTTRNRAARRADAKAASMPARAAKEAAKPRVKAKQQRIDSNGVVAKVRNPVAAPKAKASKPDPVETAPKPPKGKPKPSTAAPVPKPEPVSEKAVLKAMKEMGHYKSAGVIIEEMVRRDAGATLPQIVEATGWQPHSIRAYITATLGKKRGLPVQRTKAEGQDSVYRIVEVEEAV